jgi:hypothetical protein
MLPGKTVESPPRKLPDHVAQKTHLSRRVELVKIFGKSDIHIGKNIAGDAVFMATGVRVAIAPQDFQQDRIKVEEKTIAEGWGF